MTRAERDELLAKWDRAVALHREYWRLLDCGQNGTYSFSVVRKLDHDASVALAIGGALSFPDAVAQGGTR